MPIKAKDFEREYVPDGSALGRGHMLTHREAESIDATGFEPFQVLRDGWPCPQKFPIYGFDGSPNGAFWFAYVREENGKHFIAAFEVLA